ncbi:unnamed protein product [Rodentolepis nana]|uniref:Transmembrane protein n=1 Tax=Rodentolepis nana TaxID=102285 RepID=A0A0R3TNL6_RODNA|nr:unnamed protein product [Rodentolepis nana]
MQMNSKALSATSPTHLPSSTSYLIPPRYPPSTRAFNHSNSRAHKLDNFYEIEEEEGGGGGEDDDEEEVEDNDGKRGMKKPKKAVRLCRLTLYFAPEINVCAVVALRATTVIRRLIWSPFGADLSMPGTAVRNFQDWSADLTKNWRN